MQLEILVVFYILGIEKVLIAWFVLFFRVILEDRCSVLWEVPTTWQASLAGARAAPVPGGLVYIHGLPTMLPISHKLLPATNISMHLKIRTFGKINGIENGKQKMQYIFWLIVAASTY